MSVYALTGVLYLFPAISLWAAWPRRRSAAWSSAAACALIWLGGYLGPGGAFPGLWTVAGCFSMVACFYALYVVSRNAGEYERLALMSEARMKKKGELIEKVEVAKKRIHQVDTEQREVLALYGMVKGLAESLSWDDMRPKLENAVEQYLRLESFAFYVAGPHADDALKPLARRRMGSSPGASWETLQRCLQENKVSLRVPQIIKSPDFAIALPLFEDQSLIGYFYAPIPTRLDASTLLAKAQNFTDEISFAFRRIRLFQDVEKLSKIDGLTGLYRRGVLDEKLKLEVLRAQTFKTSFCLMLLDIDHFKSLNDKYGHQFGDEVLRRVGEILKGSVYDTDFVARYGGEEFAILLPRAQPDGVLRKGESVRSAMESAVFTLGLEHIKITVSIGVAHFPRDGQTSEAVVQQADQALYHAKDLGRNRVVDIIEVRKQ